MGNQCLKYTTEQPAEARAGYEWHNYSVSAFAQNITHSTI